MVPMDISDGINIAIIGRKNTIHKISPASTPRPNPLATERTLSLLTLVTTIPNIAPTINPVSICINHPAVQAMEPSPMSMAAATKNGAPPVPGIGIIEAMPPMMKTPMNPPRSPYNTPFDTEYLVSFICIVIQIVIIKEEFSRCL